MTILHSGALAFARCTLYGQRTLGRPIYRCLATHTDSLRGVSNNEDRLGSNTAASASSAASVETGTHSTQDPKSFDSLVAVVSPPIHRALTREPFRFKSMSEVQERVLALLPGLSSPYSSESSNASSGRTDLLFKSKTGTGKTLAFLVPLIDARLKQLAKMDRAEAMRTVGAVIISPTRELASQILTEAQKLASHIPGFRAHLWIGGTRTNLSRFSMTRKDIIVATPGRLLDNAQSNNDCQEALATVSNLVLDEADRLMEMGFKEAIADILTYIPRGPERQTFLCSATMPRNVLDVMRATLQPGYATIDCVPQGEPVHLKVPQTYTVLSNPADHLPHLLRLIATDQLINKGKSKIIMFFPTTKMCQLYSDILKDLADECLPVRCGRSLYEIHAKKTQFDRMRTASRFREDRGQSVVLCTTDVSARGVDYPGVTKVIQVGASSDADIYIHRIGRTGRAGASGSADMMLLPFEQRFVTGPLNFLPIKNVTNETLAEELSALAEKTSPMALAKVQSINSTVENYWPRIDARQARDAYMAQVGFYIGRLSEIGATGAELTSGLEEWYHGSLGAKEPLSISPGYFQRIGLSSHADGYPDNRPYGYDRPRSERNVFSGYSRDRVNGGYSRPGSNPYRRGADARLRY